MKPSPGRAYFLLKDPHWTFVWWHITPERIEQVESDGGFDPEEAQLTLRIHDVTDIRFNGTNSHSYSDFLVMEEINYYYPGIGVANRNYCVEVGFKTADGQFHPAVTSNTICLPPDGPSGCFEESWSTLVR